MESVSVGSVHTLERPSKLSVKAAHFMAQVCTSAWHTYQEPNRRTNTILGAMSRRVLNETHSAELLSRAILNEAFDALKDMRLYLNVVRPSHKERVYIATTY
jgi:hypothetical protein